MIPCLQCYNNQLLMIDVTPMLGQQIMADKKTTIFRGQRFGFIKPSSGSTK